ncbi:MarR family transcriptional regulator [Fodinibacter luteus]|uniref:MarR family transcriptional regulator n=1 Tax=Fodinibacter luteus TaxID=552064 RepID=A0ABP8KA63_9MICO
MPPDVNPALGSEPSVQLFRTVLVLATHLRTRMDQRLAELDLTTQQAAVLTFVEESERAPTLGETARALGTSHQNARQVVAVLERKSLVEVRHDGDDRRVRRLAVTSRVGEVFTRRDLDDRLAVTQWLGALSEPEQRQAVQLLGRVLEDLARSGPADGP